ncbi:MFS transporter [Prauserella cavernicola]|uniref:MFS transporter n=1 Tax=Prauserella cavernicola TaxID=2800127 RepID=A0A934QXL5_9PSEU|nr:MFS transporter [Prauserella cavernicola]MBK1787384.1 MFS transporter [Prauserella cavernicola]
MSSLFAHRDYRQLFTAQVVALFGTGLTTVALGLLAYELAGADAGAVLGTALAIKMITYVVVAPVVAAFADRVPRRLFLVLLDLARAGVVLALPFVTQVWQIYVLIVVLQAASAAFTPTFQAVLPDILVDERDYTKALSASQLATTMENLLSPVIAAALLSVISFHWLFAGTSAGFLASAVLVLSTRVPDAHRSERGGVWDRTVAGGRIFAATPRLRGVVGFNLVVAAAGAVVIVNTVNFVRDTLGRGQADVAWLLAANGAGTMVTALVLPTVLGRVSERSVMSCGAGLALTGLTGAILLSTVDSGEWRWSAALVIWSVTGAGTGLVLTPIGRVLRRSSRHTDRAAVFAAQFSLSHACWLLTYPIAGWVATELGFTQAWLVLAVLAVAGAVTAWNSWPRREHTVLEHVHSAPPSDAEHLVGAAVGAEGTHRHSHEFVIDHDHRRWPS